MEGTAQLVNPYGNSRIQIIIVQTLLHFSRTWRCGKYLEQAGHCNQNEAFLRKCEVITLQGEYNQPVEALRLPEYLIGRDEASGFYERSNKSLL